MADVVLQAVIQKAVGIASNLLIQEVSRLSTVKEDIDWIESEMRLIQSYLDDADAKQGAGDKAVATLLNEIRDLGLDVEDILDKYFPEIASSKKGKGFFGRLRSACGFFGYIYTTHKFTVEVEGIKTRVNEIHRRRLTYGIQEKSGGYEGGTIWDERRSFPHIDEPNVVGFEEHIKKLVAIMLHGDSQRRFISITGMAGLGKTTLAKKVYNSVLQRFDCSAWICVSQQPNIPELLRDIARQVGLNKEEWEHNVEANLFKVLHRKRYVIVIDDLWQNEPWDYALKNGIPNNSERGSRIILTSRNRDVGIHVGGQSSLYELQPLNSENSRNLFFKMVRGDPLHQELVIISQQILKKCGGVPLAIVLIAGMLLLRERTETAWNRVLQSMGQEEDQCSKIFALSYKDLPTQLKPCFLYFGLFPEDYEILAFDLINLWAAEGFIPRGNGLLREVEEVGEDYLNHLVARNLIQVARRRSDGGIKSCRIHDILYSLSARVGKEEIKLFNALNDIATASSVTRVRRVTTDGSNLGKYIYSDSKTAKLRAILCFDRTRHEWKEEDMNFLGGLRFLRVLSVQCSSSLGISLPSETRNLSHLSYIRLEVRSGRIKLPSAISSLTNLQTLDAQECEKLIIPVCVWKIKQLRHLLLPTWGKTEFVLEEGNFDHPIEASSVNLQTLYGLDFKNYHWPSNYRFSKFTNLRKLGFRFQKNDLSNVKGLLDATTTTRSYKLEILRLEAHPLVKDGYDIVDLNLSRYVNLFRLHLEGSTMKELPEHDKFPPNLTKLTLHYTCLEVDPMKTLKKLPKLKILKLGLFSYVEEKLMVCSAAAAAAAAGGGGGGPNNFPQLQVLEINHLPRLNEFIVEEEVMPRLNKLRITNCGCLVISIPNRIRNTMITQ